MVPRLIEIEADFVSPCLTEVASAGNRSENVSRDSPTTGLFVVWLNSAELIIARFEGSQP